MKEQQQKNTPTSTTAAKKEEPLVHQPPYTYKLITNGKEEILKSS